MADEAPKAAPKPAARPAAASEVATTPADAAVQPALDHPALDVTNMSQEDMIARLRQLEAQMATLTTPTASGGDNFGPDTPVWSESAQASLYPENPDAAKELGLNGAKALIKKGDLEEGQEVIDFNVRGDKVILVLNDGSKIVKDYKG